MVNLVTVPHLKTLTVEILNIAIDGSGYDDLVYKSGSVKGLSVKTVAGHETCLFRSFRPFLVFKIIQNSL
jgi:hypothetical protein